MSVLLLWGMLTAKHILLSHILDMGYSESRYRLPGQWRVPFTQNVAIELILTAVILLEVTSTWMVDMLVGEAVMLFVALVLDRRPIRGRELSVHLIGELGMFGMYGVIAFQALS